MEIRPLELSDATLLARATQNVFDNQVDALLTAEFLADPRHHIIAAIDGSTLVGFISAVHYLHPDKPTELWINEVSVAESHRGQGLARSMMERMLQLGVELRCANAWVLTNSSNEPAMRLYASVGGKADQPDVVMFEFELKAR